MTLFDYVLFHFASGLLYAKAQLLLTLLLQASSFEEFVGSWLSEMDNDPDCIEECMARPHSNDIMGKGPA